MYPSTRIKVSLEGEIARALTWEAARRNVEVADLIRRLVRSSSRQILTQFRQVHQGVRFFRAPRAPADPARFREVVQKALGPSGS